MTNKERQKQLDEQKWLISEQYGEDLSGKMTYCIKCDCMNCLHRCLATQEERVKFCLCAKAYNKLNKTK